MLNQLAAAPLRARPVRSPQDLPADWQCPVCGAEKRLFQSRAKELAGFAENQVRTIVFFQGAKEVLVCCLDSLNRRPWRQARSSARHLSRRGAI